MHGTGAVIMAGYVTPPNHQHTQRRKHALCGLLGK